MPRNPGSRARPSGNPSNGGNYLALTRDQFTATSPLNLIQVRAGSTPGGVRVNGRELIGSALAPSAIAGVFTRLQVGGFDPIALVPANFPRLSAYTNLYEYYKFHRISILFQANQPTTSIGEVLVAVDYDVKDTAPASSIAMMRNISSTMANVYSDASLEVLGSLSRLPKYATSQTGTADTAQVQQAALYVAVEGVTATLGQALGYIVVQYDVEFFTPQ